MASICASCVCPSRCGISDDVDITWRHKTDEAIAVLNDVIPMVRVSTEAEADIPIYVMEPSDYEAYCPLLSAGCAVIYIEPDATGRYAVIRSWVRIRNNTPSNANLVAHEIIHALGVSAHSPNRNDVMYHEYSQADTTLDLSARDILIIQLLYQQPAPRRGFPEARVGKPGRVPVTLGRTPKMASLHLNSMANVSDTAVCRPT